MSEEIKQQNRLLEKSIIDLEKFIIDNDDLEKLEDMIASFNLFEAIGMKRQEIRHSATLEFLLSPQNKHGLGQSFLKRLLKDITRAEETEISPIDVDCTDLTDAEVRCEWKNIDILIICKSAKIIIAIENKIDAHESKKQLEKYRETVEKEWTKSGGYKILLVFLTIEGEKAQNDVGWIPYSHGQVVELLEKSLITNSTNIGNDQEVLIRHYITLMRRHILSDSEEARLAKKIYKEHKGALDLIFEHKPDLREDIGMLIKDWIKNQPELKLRYSSKAIIRFTPAVWGNFNKKWCRNNGKGPFSDAPLVFEIYLPSNLNKIHFELVVGNITSEENKRKLLEKLKNNKTFSIGKQTQDYPRAWREPPINPKFDNKDEEKSMGDVLNKLTKIVTGKKYNELVMATNEILKELGARSY